MRAILLGLLCGASFGCPSGQNTVVDGGSESDGGLVGNGGQPSTT